MIKARAPTAHDVHDHTKVGSTWAGSMLECIQVHSPVGLAFINTLFSGEFLWSFSGNPWYEPGQCTLSWPVFNKYLLQI